MKPMGFSNLEQLEPLKVINFMIPLLNHIFSSIEKIRDDFFKRNIEIVQILFLAKDSFQQGKSKLLFKSISNAIYCAHRVH